MKSDPAVRKPWSTHGFQHAKMEIRAFAESVVSDQPAQSEKALYDYIRICAKVNLLKIEK